MGCTICMYMYVCVSVYLSFLVSIHPWGRLGMYMPPQIPTQYVYIHLDIDRDIIDIQVYRYVDR